MYRLAWVCLMLLVACQPVTVQRTENLLPVSVRVDDAAYWLEEWQRITELPSGQQAEILDKREQAFIESPDQRNRLRLALLLAAGPDPIRNQDRAYNLLKDMDNDEASHSAQALSALLMQMIGEQQESNGKIKLLGVRLEQSQARTLELERQLQALTDIEQKIQNRE